MSEATPSSQATTAVSDGPAQVLLSLSPIAGHLILKNRCLCQLPSRRNACHSRAELARAEAQEGEETASPDPATELHNPNYQHPSRSFLASSSARREKSWERGERAECFPQGCAWRIHARQHTQGVSPPKMGLRNLQPTCAS